MEAEEVFRQTRRRGVVAAQPPTPPPAPAAAAAALSRLHSASMPIPPASSSSSSSAVLPSHASSDGADVKPVIDVPSWTTIKPSRKGKKRTASAANLGSCGSESSDEDISDAAFFLAHAKTAHELNKWAAEVVLSTKTVKARIGKARRKLYDPNVPFFSPPLPPNIRNNTPIQFNYASSTNAWKRPKLHYIRVAGEATQPQREELSKSVVAVEVPSKKSKKQPNSKQTAKLRISLKTKQVRDCSGKKQHKAQFGKAKTPPHGSDAVVQRKQVVQRQHVDNESDSLDSLSKLQAEYRLAQLRLKYIRLKKELLEVSAASGAHSG
mmetsp:Transcript_23024/g.32482  ORF Transcript_23024/g.32482 Transcript_23024/m.32482 type:complete len:323 (+) Transcript_23024:183-1151(+)|eukprot:CAMPEP_0175100468 /NCGR_PEP_ID=MMETSP0086_2-20121207/7128_1 /TAXON_ID=136419 /ORGANISM="Unknown Unknown, Strain D1" /LENGTH=322 /DNA_ID=CAMNT_0016374631 /DNA_START=183 /DNA_END=1151 /DNA_ORIENTATION=-